MAHDPHQNARAARPECHADADLVRALADRIRDDTVESDDGQHSRHESKESYLNCLPVSQAIVARFAPEDMRGRYMAIYGISWSLPFAVGPVLAGLVMDNADPRLLYWISGLLGLMAAAAYLGLHMQMRREPAMATVEASD